MGKMGWKPGLVSLLLLAGVVGFIWFASKEKAPPLRIALSGWIGYDTIWVAQELGITTEEGVDVRILDQLEPSDSRRIYEKGSVDAFGETLVGLVVANDSPEPTSRALGVLVLDVSNGADVILAKPEISGIEGLRGRRVGLESGSPDVLMVTAALRAHGMALGDVVVVNKLQSEMKSAFLDGEVDAACSYPPFSEGIVAATGAKTLFTSAEVPGMIVDLLIVREEVVRTRKAELEALARANHRVVRMLLAGDEKVIGMIADREGVPPESVRKYATQLKFPAPAEQRGLLSEGGAVAVSLKVAQDSLEAEKVSAASERRKGLLSTAIVDAFAKD